MTEIYMLVRQNNIGQLMAFLKDLYQTHDGQAIGGQIDLMDENGNTPLLVAARYGHQECVQILLQFGADALHINRMGVNAMSMAAYSGSLPIIKMLLKYGTLEQYYQTTFIPPICAATMAGHEAVVQWFASKYQPNEELPKTIEGVTPIMLAVAYERPQLHANLIRQFPISAWHKNALGLTVADLIYYKTIMNL